MAPQPRHFIKGARKRDLRTQFAALCYRIRRGKVQVLIITSRRTKRWIMPKGWPMAGKTPGQSAAQEAWEEAGVKGKVSEVCMGIYAYGKVMAAGEDLPCIAMLYPLEVKSLSKVYPESTERSRRWVSPKRASRMVVEPELARMLRDFDPRTKRRRS
ncbi:MAG: NUDIX hydrolase [Pseudomonadota bacterium]